MTARTDPLINDFGGPLESGGQKGGSASMYADLLSNAIDSWQGELSGGALFDHVLACRIEMLASAPAQGENAYLSLAKEVAYDRALIRLCASHGITANAVDFAHPNVERSRLERALVDHGINLTDLARQIRG
jgi:hypothetical protein